MSGRTSAKPAKDQNLERNGDRSREQPQQPAVSGPHAGILDLQRAAGNRAVGQQVESAVARYRAVPAEVTVDQPADRFEEEADRVAEQMTWRLEPRDRGGQLQLEGTPGQMPPSTSGLNAQTDVRLGGQPLPESVRASLEPRLGHDLSQVRLHTDSRANATAEALNARAYTIGHNIGFGAGEFAPGTDSGRRLLTHELVHVAQQARTSTALLQRKPKKKPDNVQKKARAKKIARVILYKNSNVIELVLENNDRRSLTAVWNGMPDPGTYTLSRVNGKFKSNPVINGTANEKGYVVQWSMPKDVTFDGVETYVFTVVNDETEQEQSTETSGADVESAQGVGDNAPPTSAGDQSAGNVSSIVDVPPDVIEFFGGQERFNQLDQGDLLRVVTKFMTLTPKEREIYRQMANVSTNDLDRIERSLDRFIQFRIDTKKKIDRISKRVDEGRWDVDSIVGGLTNEELLQIGIEDRIKMIAYIANGYLVLSEDEQTILRLMTNIPRSDIPRLIEGLKANKGALLKRLEKVIDFSEYREFHEKLRPIFFASLTPEEAVKNMQNAKEFPWSDPGIITATHKVRFYYEDLYLTKEGKLHIKFWANLAFMGLPTEPIEIDPFEIIAVRFYHDEPDFGVKEGDVVFMPAVNLLALKDKQFKAELALMADVALLFAGGLGVISAGSKAKKALAALELALSVADVAIREFRAEIAKTPAGRKFLRTWDMVSTAIQIYSLARVVMSAPTVFRNLKDAFQQFKAGAGAKIDPAELAKLENQVDDIINQAEDAERALTTSGKQTAVTARASAEVAEEGVAHTPRAKDIAPEQLPAESTPSALAAREQFKGVRLEKLRKLAKRDPQAAEALLERYQRRPLATLKKLYKKDPTARQVLDEYYGRSTEELLRLEKKGDRLAKQVLDDAYGSRDPRTAKRPNLETRPTDPARAPELKQKLEDLRRETGVQRREPLPGETGQVKGGTVGVAETDIPGLEEAPFTGKSPRAGGKATEGEIKSPRTSPQFKGHAEERILNQVDDAIQRKLGDGSLQRSDLRGKTVRVRVEQEVCVACRQGLRPGSQVKPGVIKQFVDKYPELTVEIVAEGTSEVILIKNGKVIVR